MFPTKFRFNWLRSFREEDFKKSTDQKQELPVVAMFVNESGRNDFSSETTLPNEPKLDRKHLWKVLYKEW
jgi:hypothetical protein